MLPRIEHSVVVPVSVELAFRAFSDLERLLRRGIYDEASWIEGNPWQLGSRIRYIVAQPVRATISAVVTSYEPPRFVALLNHALGITAEQQVTFAASPKGGTGVRMSVEFVGKSPDLAETAVQQAIAFYTRDALDTMAALCNTWKTPSSSDKRSG
jgi:Polyketide cyclase / dehydrase and lipid transport